MLISFDRDTGTVRSAIKVLIGLCRPPDTLRSSDASIDLRTRQKEHTRKQKELAEERDCTWEIPAMLITERNGINFQITGRADLLTEGGETVIEVKTAQPMPQSPATHHLLQLLFYANALDAKKASMVYTDPDSKESLEFPVDPEDRNMIDLWDGFIEDVSLFVQSEWKRHRELNIALERLSFPFDSIRPGQEEIISSVKKAGDEREELLLQAPTGTGKTAAVLTGAIPPVVTNWRILFFLTAKNTQKKILAETMTRFIDQGFPLRTIILSSRENSCPMDMERCNPELCPYAEEFGPRIKTSGIIDRLTEKVLIKPEDIMRESIIAEVCPFELALFVSQRCDLIACDYNYVFDPSIRLKRFFDDDGTASRCTLLIDEAANLPERVRGIWSPEIKTQWMEKTWKYARGNSKLQNLLRPWRKLLQAYADQPWSHKENEVRLPDEIDLPGITSRKWQKILGGDMNAPREAGLLCRAIYRFSRVSERLDDKFHLIARKEGNDTLIQWYCTDPSTFIAEEHSRCSSVTGFSATLEPMDHFAAELGLGKTDSLTAKAVGWPFPRENLAVWVDTGINTRWRYRDEQTQLIIEKLQGARTKSPGTWMAFFPSFSWMEKIALAGEDSGLDLIAQRREMTEHDRAEFVELINSGDHLILAVAGGLFAEGVDLSIPDLRGCFIAGPSLPSVSLRQKLLQERYDDTKRDGFLHAFAIPGVNRVIQAAGRLIRNSEQKADLILLGGRFIRDPYFTHLPEHWFPLRVIRYGRVSLKHRMK
ncbi:MAG: PD-(D/E)XK nuclease family protein [Candidatus Sabulitectum sp.]|nr:PD-(D/E)XK nuclease family protein [Candidatus Sabulitectum sp.]